MACIFFGHKDAPSAARCNLKKVILDLIEKEAVKKFYVGNNGNFDLLVQSVLKEISRTHHDIVYRIVLSRLDECAIGGEQVKTVFPEGLEGVPPRFAICKKMNGY